MESMGEESPAQHLALEMKWLVKYATVAEIWEAVNLAALTSTDSLSCAWNINSGGDKSLLFSY